jgi:acyl carrier protein
LRGTIDILLKIGFTYSRVAAWRCHKERQRQWRYPDVTGIRLAGQSPTGFANMPVRSEITALFEQVAKEQNKRLAPLSDDLVLLESGLDSLCFAIIVARLEDKLGFDPFSAAEGVDFPVTVGDFIKLYEDAAT